MARRQDFDLSFQDEGVDELEGEESESETSSPRNIEELPQPPMLGGSPQYSDIHGSSAHTVGGRAVNVRLFSQAAVFPQVVQLRVWKVETGVPVGLGVIDAAATEEDLVRQWYAAMPRSGEGRAIFKLRPIDMDGREIGQEITIPISEHHAVLQQIRSAMSPLTPPVLPAPTASIPNDILGLMRETINGTTKALDDERARARELMAEMARERVDLASNAATGVQAIAERMMQTEAQRAEASLKAEQQRNQQASDSMAAFFQSQLELLRADREKSKEESERTRERDELRFQQAVEEERRRRDRDQQEWERRMAQERQDFERRMRQEKEEAERKLEREKMEREERERERDRQHQTKLREMEIQKERDREHAERMMQLQQAQLTVQSQAAGGGLKDTIKEVSGLLRNVGIEPVELVQKLLTRDDGGGGGPGEGWTDLIGKVAGVAGEVIKEQVKSKGRIAQAEAAPQFAPTYPMVPYGYAGVPGMPQVAGYLPPPGVPAMPYGYPQPGQPMPAQAMPGYPVPQQALPSAMPEPDDADEDDDEDEDDEEDDEADATQTVALNPATQNTARLALRALIGKLGKAQEGEWEGLIAASIAAEPSIYHWIQAVTVKRALDDGGANPKLAARIIAALRASSLVPPDLRYE